MTVAKTVEVLITYYDMPSILHFQAFDFIKNYNEASKVVYGFNFAVLAVLCLHFCFDPTECVRIMTYWGFNLHSQSLTTISS